MNYEDAVKMWGATKLADSYRIDIDKIDLTSVTVKIDFDEGYACCGGSDPNCYCSFAESPSANVVVTGSKVGTRRSHLEYKMDADGFDFISVLGEITEAGNGKITS